MSISDYKQIRANVQAEIEKGRALVRAAFDEGAQQLLKELNIESFSWTQYTPYFNDGDACVFNVNLDYPEIEGFSTDTLYDNEKFAYGTPEYEIERKRLRALEEPIAEFLSQFAEDDMEFMFGDHAKITVSSSGTEVNDYDHD